MSGFYDLNPELMQHALDNYYDDEDICETFGPFFGISSGDGEEDYIEYYGESSSLPLLPYEKEKLSKYFELSKIWVHSDSKKYIIANLAKGGVIKAKNRFHPSGASIGIYEKGPYLGIFSDIN